MITCMAGILVLFGLLVGGAPPPLPATPAPVGDLLYLRPFSVEEGFTFEWRKERPLVHSGYVLVLKVDPDLVYPRQSLEPVLYAGPQTAERVNVGYPSGHVVALVPGRLDLTALLIWFGAPELPERVDASMVERERQAALARGIKPLASERVDAARLQGGEVLKVATRADLYREIAPLIRRYCQGESALADNLEVITTSQLNGKPASSSR